MNMADHYLASSEPSLAWAINPRQDWIRALLRYTNDHCGERDRDLVIGAVCHATGGGADGLALADEWYRRRGDYPGPDELALTWRSAELESTCRNGFAVLCEMVEAYGFEPLDICSEAEPGFDVCDYTISHAAGPQSEAPLNALARYSLKGHRSEVARTTGDQVQVLGRLALSNQLTAIYGSPGIGKSLIAMSLIADAITQGCIDAEDVYYLDFDTNPTGLLEKIDIAEAYGFNVLSDGYFEFNSRKFLEVLDELIAKNQATGTLIVLDTLKKFVSIMDKNCSSTFANRLRRYSKAGGTCVALAHVNKHATSEGRPIYAGTSGILEDFDCAFLMYQVAIDADAQTKTVVFENIKARGDVARQASYRYSIAERLTYSELLDSVVSIEDSELSAIKRSAALDDDAVVIDAISDCIRAGIVTKMELVAEAAKRANVSRRAALAVIDRYTGTDPALYRWVYTVHERGAKKYKLLIDSTASITP